MAATRKAAKPKAHARHPHPHHLEALHLVTAGAEASASPGLTRAHSRLRTDSRRWLYSAAVQGVGIGRRTVERKDTDEVVLKVFVDRKLPLSKLHTAIPKFLRLPESGRRIEIDVEQVGRIVREAGPLTRARPARPGNGVGLADAAYGTGTLGCIVRRRGDPDTLYLLSNAHVIAQDGLAPHGTPVLQPSGENGGTAPADVLAYLEKSLSITYSDTGYYNIADAAIARFARPADASAEIFTIGVPAGPGYTITQDMRVRIAGATSGYAEGVVRAQNFFFSADYEVASGATRRAGFRNQVLCTSYSKPGDSGAAVADAQGRIVGLHVAGSNDGDAPCSVFSPIAPVLEELQLELVTRAQPVLAAAAAMAVSAAPAWLAAIVPALSRQHSYDSGVAWQLTPAGLRVNGKVETTQGEPATVAKILARYRASLLAWAEHFRIPVELIVATICTESGGNPDAVRQEPNYVSDEATPAKISAGLTQILISTARAALGNPDIDRGWLLVPDHAIQAGTAYMDSQRGLTRLDPPKVACAYNAGGIYKNGGAANRWRMRQYPIGSSAHADRFVAWFNDCFRVFRAQGSAPETSFFSALN